MKLVVFGGTGYIGRAAAGGFAEICFRGFSGFGFLRALEPVAQVLLCPPPPLKGGTAKREHIRCQTSVQMQRSACFVLKDTF